MLEGPISSFVERMLDFTAKRQQVLSNNLANLDTPGYKAKDVSFSDALSAAASASVSTYTPQESDVEAEAKPNGNTVDLENQMTQMTQNGLRYVLLIQYLGSQVKSLRYSISEGTKG